MPLRTTRRTRYFPFTKTTTRPSIGLRLRLRTVQNLLESGKVDGAIQAAQSLLTAAPYDPRVLALNAQCMVIVGNQLAAIQIYDRLLAQQDSDVI